MTTDEELLTSSLRTLGDGGLEDAELERRVSQFQGALRRLRDDPAEAARVDALVMDAELGQPDVKALGSGIGVINVSGGNVTITPGYPGDSADAEDRINAALARLERQMQRLAVLQETLKETSARTQPRPRRIWETLLRPAFGGGILAAILGITAVTATIHASAAAMSVIGIILAAATAVTALFSLLVPWTSVRALNRRGDAHRALELVCGRDIVTTAHSSDMVTASGESKTHGGESERVENPGSGRGAVAARPRFSPRTWTHGGHREWVTIRYALDSYARTFRLCLILLVTILPVAAVVTVVALIHHALLCDPCARRASHSHQRRETSPAPESR